MRCQFRAIRPLVGISARDARPNLGCFTRPRRPKTNRPNRNKIARAEDRPNQNVASNRTSRRPEDRSAPRFSLPDAGGLNPFKKRGRRRVAGKNLICQSGHHRATLDVDVDHAPGRSVPRKPRRKPASPRGRKRLGHPVSSEFPEIPGSPARVGTLILERTLGNRVSDPRNGCLTPYFRRPIPEGRTERFATKAVPSQHLKYRRAFFQTAPQLLSIARTPCSQRHYKKRAEIKAGLILLPVAY